MAWGQEGGTLIRRPHNLTGNFIQSFSLLLWTSAWCYEWQGLVITNRIKYNSTHKLCEQ